MRFRATVVTLCVILAGISAFAADKPLTNEDIISLVKAGLDDATIIAKIDQAGRSALDTSVDGLIRLKKASVPKTIIEAMLAGPSSPKPSASAAAMGKSDVQLVTATGAFDLQSLVGESSATYIFVGFKLWLNFDKPHAAIRTTDTNPTLRVKSSQRPESRWLVVRLDSNRHDRSVKMGKSSAFTGTSGARPDPDWTISFSSTEEAEGIWKLTLGQHLEKGEYGLLHENELYDFGVD
jgi:hypothetical protein